MLLTEFAILYFRSTTSVLSKLFGGGDESHYPPWICTPDLTSLKSVGKKVMTVVLKNLNGKKVIKFVLFSPNFGCFSFSPQNKTFARVATDLQFSSSHCELI